MQSITIAQHERDGQRIAGIQYLIIVGVISTLQRGDLLRRSIDLDAPVMPACGADRITGHHVIDHLVAHPREFADPGWSLRRR